MSIEKEKIRLLEFDFLRAFAILGVLSIHTFGYFSHNQQVDNITFFAGSIDALSLASVPLFVFISGFVLTIKSAYKDKYINFIGNRIKRIIIPYLFFSFIYNIYFHLIDKTKLNYSEIIKNFIIGRTAFHLYYIPIILELYFVYHICYKFVVLPAKFKFLFPLISLFVLYVWTFQDLIFKHFSFNPFSAFPYAPTLFSFGQVLFYFVLGIYIAANYEHFKKKLSQINGWIILFITGCLVFTYTEEWMQGIQIYGSYYKIPSIYFFPTRLLLPVINLSLFIMWYKIADLLKKYDFNTNLFKQISYHSFGIFFIHILFNDLLVRALSKAQISSDRWTFYIILYFPTLIASFYTIKFMSKFSIGRKLLGNYQR